MKQYIILSFNSTHAAISCEKKLKNSYEVDIIPIPRDIDADCGICVRFQEKDMQDVMATLRLESIPYKGVYRVEGVGRNKKITELETKQGD